MEIELQNNNNVGLSLTSSNTEIDFTREEHELELEEREYDIELVQNNLEIELGTSSILIPSNHAELYNLDYENSGHTGFQEEMDALTNIEIERMWNSI